MKNEDEGKKSTDDQNFVYSRKTNRKKMKLKVNKRLGKPQGGWYVVNPSHKKKRSLSKKKLFIKKKK